MTIEKLYTLPKKSVENIPYSHCRILQETEERNIVEGIENARERKSGKPLYLALRVLYNQGNRKYPHWIETVELIDIKNVEAHETPCRLYGRKKDNILAFIKQKEGLKKEGIKVERNNYKIVGKFETDTEEMVVVNVGGKAACVMSKYDFERIIASQRMNEKQKQKRVF